MGDSDNLRTNDVASFGKFRLLMTENQISRFSVTPDHRADLCLGDRGIVSGDTLSSLPLLATRNWTEVTGFLSCKTSGLDHDNHSFKRVNAEPLTFEDRACYGRNRSESL
jgi:hypothetical protein